MSRNIEERLRTAINSRDKDQFLHLLQLIPDPTGVTVKGSSILYWAARKGWWDIVCQLASNHNWPPTHTMNSISGRTVLHRACSNNYGAADTDTVRYLTNTLCLDPLQKDNYRGETPLDWSTGTTREYLEQLIGKLEYIFT